MWSPSAQDFAMDWGTLLPAIVILESPPDGGPGIRRTQKQPLFGAAWTRCESLPTHSLTISRIKRFLRGTASRGPPEFPTTSPLRNLTPISLQVVEWQI